MCTKNPGPRIIHRREKAYLDPTSSTSMNDPAQMCSPLKVVDGYLTTSVSEAYSFCSDTGDVKPWLKIFMTFRAEVFSVSHPMFTFKSCIY